MILVMQLAVFIEYEHMRCGNESIQPRGFLRCAVVEIRKVKVLVLCPVLHVLKRISHICVTHFRKAEPFVGIRRNRHYSHALAFVVSYDLFYTFLIGLRSRTMI